MKQNALINNIIKIESKEKEILKNILLVLGGVVFLSLMAQVMIPLPYTPVPITLGSFAVTLMGLLYGRKLATATFLSYVAAGTAGIPVFANFKTGVLFSPSGGYIFGYIVAAIFLGYLADKGFTKSYAKTILALIIANIIIYALGVLQLSLFVPNKDVFKLGVYPFLVGDTLKMMAVASLVPTLWKFVPKNDK